MFDVIECRSEHCSEVIGRAKKIKFGFKINIFNGNEIILVKSKKYRERYEIYEKIENLIRKKRGFGKLMDFANEWVEFDHSSSRKAYIYLERGESFAKSEFKEVTA